MKQTQMPFYEVAEDATNSAILRSGKTYQQVAHYLRPDIKLEVAYAWLKNALREEAREKLTTDQHIAIANFCEEYDYTYYVALHCHHSRPEPVEPADEALQLDREINDSLKAIEKMLQRRERINIKSVAGS